MGLDRVAERAPADNTVSVSPADTLDIKVPFLLELPNNPLGGPFGDADPVREIPQPQVGITSERKQNVGVVGKKRPGKGVILRHRASAKQEPYILYRISGLFDRYSMT
jgi:hypothetical protein